MTGAIRPAVSALAWPAEREAEMLALAARLGFRGVDVLPVRLLGPLAEATPAAVAEWRRRFTDLGLAVPALQGVLFGVPGLHLFRSADERGRLAAALADVARVAGAFGADAAVFGAPGLRDPGALRPAEAMEIAATFLATLAPVFEAEGTALTFEPVAPALGGRFATTTAEAAALVRMVDRPGIRLQLDTGNLIEHGDGDAQIADAAPVIGHAHLSEPRLAPLGSRGSDHAVLGRALRAVRPRGWVSVEMLPAADPVAALDAAWDVVAAAYLAREG